MMNSTPAETLQFVFVDDYKKYDQTYQALHPTAKKVYGYILMRAMENNGFTKYNNAKIAENIHITKRHVIRLINHLRSVGLLSAIYQTRFYQGVVRTTRMFHVPQLSIWFRGVRKKIKWKHDILPNFDQYPIKMKESYIADTEIDYYDGRGGTTKITPEFKDRIDMLGHHVIPGEWYDKHQMLSGYRDSGIKEGIDALGYPPKEPEIDLY
ncbi:MAG: hypothetical protein ACREGB_03155 [Candidatus Saccharimonadales bacterium]